MNQKHGRKSWGKRGITIFLTLSLMVSLLSTAVFAEGDTEDGDNDPDLVVENLVNDNQEEEPQEEEPQEEEPQEEEPQEEEPQEEEPQDADNNGNDGIMLLSLDGDDDQCDHDWTVYPCSDGWVYQYCSKCGVKSDEEVCTVHTEEHTWSDWETVSSGCEGNWEERYCKVCNDWESRYVELGGTHEWSAPVTTSTGCETFKTYNCKNCDSSYTETEGSHDFVVEGSVTDGCYTTVTYTCTRGDNAYSWIYENHEWNTYPCSSGWVYQYCSKCGKEGGEQVYAVPTVAHKGSGWQWYEENHAACASGYQYTECTVCGKTLDSRYADSEVDHTWGDDLEIYREPTACRSGYGVQICLVCGKDRIQDIPATGDAEHTWVEWDIEEATVCNTGTLYLKCEVCGTYEEETIPATGNADHTWGDWEVEREATACSTGYQNRYCKVCGKRNGEVIPATGNGEHTWSEWEVLVPATCASGIQTRTCTVCETTMQKLIPPVTSGHVHTWSNWVLTEDNGCLGGVLTRYCTAAEDYLEFYQNYIYAWEDCSDFVAPAVDTQQKTVAASGTHKWGAWEPLAQSSCYDVEQTRQCTKCGIEEYRTIEGTGQHNWGEWKEIEGDKCYDSFKARFCQNEGCDAYEQDKTGQEIYHHVAYEVRVASCIQSTYYQTYFSCSNCYIRYACDENGNQLFDESGDECYPWELDGYGYNPNNHEGGTKLVGAVEATATTNGYTGDLYCLGCDELIEAGRIIYPVLNGAASVWTPESKTGLVIRSNAAKSKFVEVRINGEVLDEKYYTVTEGSTIITISEEYLSTLENKEYTIEIVSTDGTATTTFTVEGNDAKAGIKDDTKKEEPTGAVDTKKEESTGAAETKKEETVVNTDTKKDTTKTDTKTDTKSDSASSGAKTGDESNLVLWVSALGISFAALALLTVMNKKRYTGKRVK